MMEKQTWSKRAQPREKITFKLPLVTYNRLLISKKPDEPLDDAVERYLRIGLISEGKLKE